MTQTSLQGIKSQQIKQQSTSSYLKTPYLLIDIPLDYPSVPDEDVTD